MANQNDYSKEAVELMKKLLILELFRLNVPQNQIKKRVRASTDMVNEFLKGIKDPNKQKIATSKKTK